MPIRVKHAPSAEAIGESAYTIGRGQRMERDIRFFTEAALKKRSQDIQGMGVLLRGKAQAAQAEQQKQELEFRREQWQEEPGRQLQKSLQAQERLRKNITWQYSEAQKRQMEHINNGINWIRGEVTAGRWTAKDGEQAEQQLEKKRYGILPLPFYDDTATPQERYESGTVTDRTTGAKYRENERGGFDPIGASYKDSADFYINIAKLFTTEDDDIPPKKTVDWEGVDEFVRKAEGRIAQRQGLSTRAEEIQQQQEAAEQEQQQEAAEEEQKVKMKAAVEALPTLFKKISEGQPKIGRKKKGKPSWTTDDVYGEEAYNNMLVEAIVRGKRDGIPPDVVKAELDEWWDEQYDKERGRRFQQFGNRMEFKGASREAVPEKGQPMRAINPKTGERIISHDGGKTWQKTQ